MKNYSQVLVCGSKLHDPVNSIVVSARYNGFLDNISDENFIDDFIEEITFLVTICNLNLSKLESNLNLRNITFFGYPFNGDNHALSFDVDTKRTNKDDIFPGTQAIRVIKTYLGSESVILPFVTSFDDIVKILDNEVNEPVIYDLKPCFEEDDINYRPILVSGYFHRNDGPLLNIGHTIDSSIPERSPGILFEEEYPIPSFVNDIFNSTDSFRYWSTAIKAIRAIPNLYLSNTDDKNIIDNKPYFYIASLKNASNFWYCELTDSKTFNKKVISNRIGVLLQFPDEVSSFKSDILHKVYNSLKTGYSKLKDIAENTGSSSEILRSDLDDLIDSINDCL